MKPSPLLIVATVFLTFTASFAGAEVVTIDVTVKAIDAKERSIIVTKTSKTKSKDIELEVGKTAKILVGGKEASLDAVKVGQKVSVSYETGLEVVTKIEVTGDGETNEADGPNPTTEALNLDELNSPELDIAPWVSSDGLEIFWATEDSGKNHGIWAARRKTSDGLFEGKKRLFSGHAPVLSSDGLQMFFRNADAETISLATRKSREEEFGRPRPVPSLTFPGMDAAPRWLTQDGLTLYLDLLRDKNGRHHCWEVKRESPKSNWMKPAKTEAKFEGMPSTFRFTQVSATPDNLHLYCTTEFSNQNDQLVYRAGILSRNKPNELFTEWAELPLTGPNGMYPLCLKPQFVAATQELFLTSNAFYSDPQGIMKRRFDLWVIKDFQPPVKSPEK